MLINYIFENNDIDVGQVLMYDPEAMHYEYNIMVLECKWQYNTISPTMTRSTSISTTQHIQHIIWFNVIFYHA